MQARRHWTAAEVRELQDEQHHWPRFELIDGELLVTLCPTPAHQVAVGEFLGALHDYCDRERVGRVLLSPSDIELTPDSITQPDVFVYPMPTTRNRPLEWTDITSLVLAIEIISPSTEHTDRVTKREFYLANGVAEYWVVDLDARMVEQWSTERTTPAVARETLRWQPHGARTELEIDLSRVFAHVRGQRRAG